MPSANTYKALIATTLISSSVVFLGFTVHINKKSEFIAETYYELQPEDLEEEKLELLEDILKSFDNLISTNQAYNETNADEELEDKAFEERLEEIRNRNKTEDTPDNDKQTNESSETKSASNINEANAFSDINDIIAKTSEKKRTPLKTSNSANKNSSISYSLVNRTKIEIPPPIYLCENGGKVVINITVDQDGNVIDTIFNNASTTSNGCLVDHALEYAKASKFNPDNSKPLQLGTITFIFKGKQ